jgi:ribonuclease P protein component
MVSGNACRRRAAGWCCKDGVPRAAKGSASVDKKISERFPHSCRIVRTVDYKSIYKSGKKIHSENFVLFYCRNEIGHARLGITVSRKIGCASIRNRTKRLFREIFRRSSDALPENLDFVVNAKSGCAGIRYQDLRREFINASKRITHIRSPKD